MEYFGKTDRGYVRKNNEDSYLVKTPLFAVADGMGGHAAGEVASRIVVDCLSENIDKCRVQPDSALKGILEEANLRILAYGRANSESAAGLGTTATAAYIADGELWWAHCGDSRLYHLRNGKLQQITRDHTLVDQLVREGIISRSDAATHPQKNVLTRALGAEERVDADTGSMQLAEGDRLLLCSDGLTNMIADSEIERIISQTEKNLELRVNELVDLAKINGGVDNITVVLVEI